MNKPFNTSSISSAAPTWEAPLHEPKALPNRSAEDIALWRTLSDELMSVAKANGWTKAEVARRMNMADGTFSQWYSGKYDGRLDNQNRIVQQFLASVAESAEAASTIPTSPAFIRTRTSAEVTDTLVWAQVSADMVMITLGAGMGKTATCRQYCATRPHVYMATVSPHTKTVHGMLTELASELDVHEHNPAKLTRAIGKKLGRIGNGSLLIVDEAQNLVDDAVNQLRHFVDVYGCGVALVGNNEIYGRFTKRSDGPSFAQLRSRVGKRLSRVKPHAEDIKAFVEAWRVTDPAAVKLLTGIGMKGGALRQIDKTMKLASMLALSSGEAVTAEHVEAAWKNRDVEDIA